MFKGVRKAVWEFRSGLLRSVVGEEGEDGDKWVQWNLLMSSPGPAYSACQPVGWGLGASGGLAVLRSNVSLEEMEGCKPGKASCFLSSGTVSSFSGYIVIREHLAWMDLFGTSINNNNNWACLCSERQQRRDKRESLWKVSPRVTASLELEADRPSASSRLLLWSRHSYRLADLTGFIVEDWIKLSHFQWISLRNYFCHWVS